MRIGINRAGAFGVKEQIKRQIRMLIENGELAPGKALPSVRDMASLINVNRNTVWAAYKEMADQGWLNTVSGSGAFIAGKKVSPNNEALKTIFDRAVRQAIHKGYSPSRIADYFITRLDVAAAVSRGRGIAVVDCNQEAIQGLQNVIKRELGVHGEGVLIQDVEAGVEEAVKTLEKADLIACGLNHAEELKQALPSVKGKLVATLLKPDIRLMNELLQASAGIRLGVVCVHRRSAETLHKNLPFAHGSSLVKVWAGMDNPDDVRRVVKQCDVVYATEYVYEAVKKVVPPGRRVVEVSMEVDPALIEVIRERLFLMEAI